MLFKKMLRDMKIYKIQFISILLMSFLAMFIYSGLGSESRGYEVQLDKYYSDTNLADAWMYGGNFTEEDENIVENIDGVEEAQRRLSVDVEAKLEKSPTITLYFQDKNEVNKTYLNEGEEFDPDDKEGLWIDYEFAKARDLSVGDELKLKYMGINLTQKIKGIVMSPEYVYKENTQMMPDHNMNGFAFISYKALPEGLPHIYNQMVLKTHNNSDEALKKIEDEAYEIIKSNENTGSMGLSVFLKRANLTSDVVFRNEITERKAMTSVFPIVFLAIALLTILTTMSRLVKNQRTQIGILKALGFRKNTIMRHYIMYGFGLTLIGGILGSVTGPLILPIMFYGPMQTVYTLPVWKPAFFYTTLIVLAITVVAATLITYITCRSILKDIPAEVLRPKAPKKVKATAIEKTHFWKKRSFITQWNTRDILRSKARSVMAILGISGCMGLLITGFGCLDAFNSLKTIKYDDICKYENKYILDETVTEEQENNILEKTSGAKVMKDAIEIKSEDDKETTEMTVREESSLYKYYGKDWQEIKLSSDGIAISLKIAEKLDVDINDKVKWHIYGNSTWYESKITDIYRDPAEQGVVVSINELEKINIPFKTSYILSDKEKITGLDGVKTIENIEESKENISTMLESMYLLIGVVCVLAAVLAIVVLYNLGVLSYAEKERELATLKVLGFRTGKLRKLLLVENIWLTLVGLPLGYILGQLILRAVMASMGTEFDLPITVSAISIIISTVFTMILSIVVNYIFSGRLRKLDMVSSLKGVE